MNLAVEEIKSSNILSEYIDRYFELRKASDVENGEVF